MVLNSAVEVEGTLSDRADAPRRLVRQSDLARELGVSDKRVATWRTRTRANGFPEAVACHFGPVSKGGKRRHLLWDLGEVLAWFERYDERAQRARGGTMQKGRKYAPDRSYTTPKPEGLVLKKPAPKTTKKPITTEALLRVRNERQQNG